MDVDEALTSLEAGAETEAEQIDEETELDDVEAFQDDEEFVPQAEEEDLEEAYDDFYFAGEGPQGEGDVDSDGNDGGLAVAVAQAEGLDLSEEGFHVVDESEARALSDDLAGDVAVFGDGEPFEDEGSIDAVDAEDLDAAPDVSQGTPRDIDEANAQEEMQDDQVEDALDSLDDAEVDADADVDDDGFDVDAEDGDDDADDDAEDAEDDDTEDITLIKPADDDDDDTDDDDDYEIVELELDEDDIVRYIEDEEGNRIGFVIMEDGEEAEYLYVDDEDVYGDDEEDEFDFGITKEGVAEATNDMNAIYKDGIAVAAELKGAFDDIKGALDFTSFLKK